jgi:hypothetical protein
LATADVAGGPAGREQAGRGERCQQTTVDPRPALQSAITCREFVWTEAIAARNKTVTIVAPLPISFVFGATSTDGHGARRGDLNRAARGG